MSSDVNKIDIVIIGGGLAGLATAALLSRAGKSVTLIERSSREIGGRARTTEIDGFHFNQGPHALCLTDATDTILKEIGISYTGNVASGKAHLIINGEKHEVAGDYGSWFSYGTQDENSAESDGSQFFISPTEIDFSKLENVTVQEWLDKNIHDTNRAEIVKTILRLNTYGNNPEIQSIGSVIRQIYVASRRGYMYIDGGWQTLVDGLLDVAKNAGTKVIMGEKAIKVKKTDSSGWSVLLSDKTQISSNNAIIAAGPLDAYNLFDDSERPEVLSKFAKEAKPVRLVCLDVVSQ